VTDDVDGDAESGRAISQEESNREKGARNEREACRILGARYRAERITTEHDPFHLADLMGLQGGFPFALVQVKTNQFSAEYSRYYKDWAHRKIDGEHTIFEVWVRKDRAGWEMHRLDPESMDFECYFQTSTCDPSKVRDGWRAAFMEVTDVDGDGRGGNQTFSCGDCGGEWESYDDLLAHYCPAAYHVGGEF